MDFSSVVIKTPGNRSGDVKGALYNESKRIVLIGCNRLPTDQTYGFIPTIFTARNSVALQKRRNMSANGALEESEEHMESQIRYTRFLRPFYVQYTAL